MNNERKSQFFWERIAMGSALFVIGIVVTLIYAVISNWIAKRPLLPPKGMIVFTIVFTPSLLIFVVAVLLDRRRIYERDKRIER